VATKTYDDSIGDLAKALINALIADAHENRNETSDLDKIRGHLMAAPLGQTLEGVTALSAYMAARATERQAIAMESVAKAVGKIQAAETANTDAQAIIDSREPVRENLASTYSLPSGVLLLLWSMRGILMDASIKSLSRPDRFDPFRKVTTAEIAWSLRMTSDELIVSLPDTADGGIDFDLLQAFGIMHYGGDDGWPDDWMYGG